jgi:hypothetical protein
MSNNILLTKSFNAGGALLANSIVKAGANDYDVLQGAAATDVLIGITTEVASNSGERADVIMIGIADLKINGVVARGAQLTSDATGLGISAAPAAGSNNRIIGTALISGVAGDIIPVLVGPSMLQG